MCALGIGEKAWPDFGSGSKKAVGETEVARGRWLVLSQAYVNARWQEPIARVHVGVCTTIPNLADVPDDGDVGVWIESHATMRHLE